MNDSNINIKKRYTEKPILSQEYLSKVAPKRTPKPVKVFEKLEGVYISDVEESKDFKIILITNCHNCIFHFPHKVAKISIIDSEENEIHVHHSVLGSIDVFRSNSNDFLFEVEQPFIHVEESKDILFDIKLDSRKFSEYPKIPFLIENCKNIKLIWQDTNPNVEYLSGSNSIFSSFSSEMFLTNVMISAEFMKILQDCKMSSVNRDLRHSDMEHMVQLRDIEQTNSYFEYLKEENKKEKMKIHFSSNIYSSTW